MVDFTTPAGRIVWGNPLNGRAMTDDRTKQPKLDQSGQPMTQWAFGLAIPKAEATGLYQAMQQAAAEVFPGQVPGNFSWKLKDGDGVDAKGQPYNTREGYAGNVILAISTTAFQPQVVRLVNGAYIQTDDLKTGDYVRAAVSFKAHQSQTPGLYVNPVMIEFLGYGEAIVNGPDAQQVFGGQAVALPPGASAAPTAPAGGMPVGNSMPGGPANPAAAPTGPAVPAGGPAAPAQPSTPGAVGMPGSTASPSNPVQPAHDFVQNAGQMPPAFGQNNG